LQQLIFDACLSAECNIHVLSQVSRAFNGAAREATRRLRAVLNVGVDKVDACVLLKAASEAASIGLCPMRLLNLR
jgi:hypothetical protein